MQKKSTKKNEKKLESEDDYDNDYDKDDYDNSVLLSPFSVANDDILKQFSFDQLDGMNDFSHKETNGPNFSSKVHLHIRKRNARKMVTTIEGLDEKDIDCKKFISMLRKKLNCNGTVKKDKDGNNVILLQGDQRIEITNFLKVMFKVNSEDIIIHGF